MNETLAEKLVYVFDYEVESGPGTPGAEAALTRLRLLDP